MHNKIEVAVIVFLLILAIVILILSLVYILRSPKVDNISIKESFTKNWALTTNLVLSGLASIVLTVLVGLIWKNVMKKKFLLGFLLVILLAHFVAITIMSIIHIIKSSSGLSEVFLRESLTKNIESIINLCLSLFAGGMLLMWILILIWWTYRETPRTQSILSENDRLREKLNEYSR